MIPGGNIFNQAMAVFTPQEVVWRAFAGRTVSDSGKYINELDDPVTIKGSLQSVNRKMYEQLGLDLNKSYKNFYTNDPVMDVERDRSGDTFEYNGRYYMGTGMSDWRPQDGWRCILLVDIGVRGV
jgi:hypothetical protein